MEQEDSSTHKNTHTATLSLLWRKKWLDPCPRTVDDTILTPAYTESSMAEEASSTHARYCEAVYRRLD
jgi:hypothetical protein